MDLTTSDQQARRIEQLERDNYEMRRTIERLAARLERIEATSALPRTVRMTTTYADPLGR